MARGKVITCCGDCIHYNFRKHKCNVGYSAEVNVKERFYADCTTFGNVEEYERKAYNKAVDDCAEKILLELSESLIWSMLVNCHKDNSFDDTADKIVDYVADVVRNISEQLKGVKQNERR